MTTLLSQLSYAYPSFFYLSLEENPFFRKFHAMTKFFYIMLFMHPFNCCKFDQILFESNHPIFNSMHYRGLARGLAKCTYFLFKNHKLWFFFFFNSYYKLKEFLCEQENIIVYTTVIKALYISLGWSCNWVKETTCNMNSINN